MAEIFPIRAVGLRLFSKLCWIHCEVGQTVICTEAVELAGWQLRVR